MPNLLVFWHAEMAAARETRLRRIAIQGCTVYGIFCFLVFLFQRSLLFFPSHNATAGRLAPWVDDGQTIGYCREVTTPETVWLMMHGNAGQASDRDYVLDHLSARDALYVLEYPGYGTRDGKPSKSSIDAAAQQAYRVLRERYGDVPVCVIGESIGSGPAAVLATERQAPDKIVLITPFDTLYRVAARKFFIMPVGLLLLDRWDNIAALRGYQEEVDIYGAEADKIIPMDHARALSEACPNAILQVVPGGHNDWSFCSQVKISR